jgi:hypothetical protein
MKTMWILIASLVALGFVAALAGIQRNRKLAKQLANGEIAEMPEVKMVLDCGADSCELDEGKSCDLDCMTPIIKQDIDYYDDEELDAYKGKASDQYTDDEAEEFRNVFYTMQEEDVPGWVKSLQQRELEIPDSLKDEVLLVLREIRKKNNYGNNKD